VWLELLGELCWYLLNSIKRSNVHGFILSDRSGEVKVLFAAGMCETRAANIRICNPYKLPSTTTLTLVCLWISITILANLFISILTRLVTVLAGHTYTVSFREFIQAFSAHWSSQSIPKYDVLEIGLPQCSHENQSSTPPEVFLAFFSFILSPHLDTDT